VDTLRVFLDMPCEYLLGALAFCLSKISPSITNIFEFFWFFIFNFILLDFINSRLFL
jgi:hypothetical protein